MVKKCVGRRRWGAYSAFPDPVIRLRWISSEGGAKKGCGEGKRTGIERNRRGRRTWRDKVGKAVGGVKEGTGKEKKRREERSKGEWKVRGGTFKTELVNE